MERMTLAQLLDMLTQNYGCLNTKTLGLLAQRDRLRPVLVRCGNCRFTCAAQDAAWLCDIIKRDGQDYVRDINLLADDGAFAGDYTPVTQDPVVRKITRPTSEVAQEFGIPERILRGNSADIEPSDADPGL